MSRGSIPSRPPRQAASSGAQHNGVLRVVRYRSLSCLIADYERNLSRGWLFVNTRRPLPVGTRLRLVLSLKEPQIRLVIDGVVARVASFGNGLNDTPGMRIRLLSMQPEAERFLLELMHRLPAQPAPPPRELTRHFASPAAP